MKTWRLITGIVHVFIIIILVPDLLLGQDKYPKDYFRSPVDFRILLSGTFGELRSGHFHSGMDIKTNGKTGEKIYAVADGYVSRIKISAYGFGRTLYVTHPNSYVSVYAHLQGFNEMIAAYVKKEHYNRESFELNIFPEKDELPVKKGEIIAQSGNSGYSFGPHLHFELREETTQIPMNPLLFGIEVKDFIRPKIKKLKIYPVDKNSMVNSGNAPVIYDIEGWGEMHRLPGYDTITVSGKIAFGVYTYDLLNDASNKNGVYSIKLYLDSLLIYDHDLEKISFDETRYINSLIDYADFKENKYRYQRTIIDPNNNLSIYNEVLNKGVINFTDAAVHRMAYEISDAMGNISKLIFHVRGEHLNSINTVNDIVEEQPEGVIFHYSKDNLYSNELLRFEAPKYAFYDSFHFNYDSTLKVENSFSRVHIIHNDKTPIHSYCTLSIKPENLPDSILDKALIAKIDDEGGLQAAGGEFADGFVTTRIRDFGAYCVAIDTIPPEVNLVKPLLHKGLKGQKFLKFIIKDEFSGIKSYRGELNGEWLLMEYDAKNDLLYYFTDERLKAGSNDLILEVIDNKGNVTIYEAELIN